MLLLLAPTDEQLQIPLGLLGSSSEMPRLAVEVAFRYGTVSESGFTVSPAGVSSPVWYDITAYVHGLTIRRGRSTQLDKFQAGTCQVTLDNSDRRFDPEYSAGPYYGYVLPNRRIRVRAQWASTDYFLFDGFVDEWPQEYSPPNKATTTVNCTDAFGIFAKLDVGDAPYVTEVLQDSPDTWFRLSHA